MNDLIADLLARLKNGIERRKEVVSIPNTKVNVEVLKVLKEEEMIEDYEIIENVLEVTLKYEEDGEPVVTEFKRVSKPGQRIYVSSYEIIPVMNGRGISIISTSKGLMTGSRAKSQNIGGELICKVW